MTYYVKPSGRIAEFALLDARRRTLAEVRGTLTGLEPTNLDVPADSGSYELVTVDGIVEVIAHRRMEPVFYITHEQNVLKKLGVTRVESGTR